MIAEYQQIGPGRLPEEGHVCGGMNGDRDNLDVGELR